MRGPRGAHLRLPPEPPRFPPQTSCPRRRRQQFLGLDRELLRTLWFLPVRKDAGLMEVRPSRSLDLAGLLQGTETLPTPPDSPPYVLHLPIYTHIHMYKCPHSCPFSCPTSHPPAIYLPMDLPTHPPTYVSSTHPPCHPSRALMMPQALR